MLSRDGSKAGCILVFLFGVLSPFGALVLQPMDYSFYMFIPATPPEALERARLVAADIVLVAGTVVSAAAGIALSIQGIHDRQFRYLLLPVLVLLHPLQQPVFLERLDTYLNHRWLARVEALGIIGKAEQEARGLLGSPSAIWTQPRRADGAGGMRPGYTAWEYKPLPFYWLGSKGQVFLVDGRVESVEGNDD